MPDEHDYDDDQDQESPVIRDLRRKARKADELETETAALRQKVAILEAGITDLTPAKQKALLAAHEGDLEPEAIRRTAAELGFITEAKGEEPQVPVEEQQAHRKMAEATAAAIPSEATTKTFDELMREAASSPESLQAFLDQHGLIEHD